MRGINNRHSGRKHLEKFTKIINTLNSGKFLKIDKKICKVKKILEMIKKQLYKHRK